MLLVFSVAAFFSETFKFDTILQPIGGGQYQMGSKFHAFPVLHVFNPSCLLSIPVFTVCTYTKQLMLSVQTEDSASGYQTPL